MEKTVILNKEQCGYSYFVTMGKTIIVCGHKGTRKLDILRVVVVSDNSIKRPSFLGRQLISSPAIDYDVDMDVYLTDGTEIQIHSSEKKFLRKLMPYIWELRRKDPRIEFYGVSDPRADSIDTSEDDLENIQEELVIIEHQIGIERRVIKDLLERIDGLLVTRGSEDIKVLKLQRQYLASRKRLIGYRNSMNRLNKKLMELEEDI